MRSYSDKDIDPVMSPFTETVKSSSLLNFHHFVLYLLIPFLFAYTPAFQLESLFSNPVYVKPQRPSVSSLHGPRDGGERKHSHEV